MKVTEIFRIKGKPVAEINKSHVSQLKFLTIRFCILNKEELNELINWLISKIDEI